MIVQGNAQHLPLADKSVQCVVTSPPYYGLRDYGVPGQLGLEPTPEEYIANMVQVFREVKRVLRDDGVLFLNIGDSYWGGKGKSGYELPHEAEERRGLGKTFQTGHNIPGYTDMRPTDGKHPVIKPKDLVGIPWMLAFALRADGWYLRSDIIWHKPNPMPESVTDRPTKAHEYVFLLSKSARYYYDAEAVRENSIDSGGGPPRYSEKCTKVGNHDGGLIPYERGSGRNSRSVWTIATQPTKEAHFATYPEKLVEPCILAGTSARGCCPECGAPWVRVTEKVQRETPYEYVEIGIPGEGNNRGRRPGSMGNGLAKTENGWQPSCSCNAGDPTPCLVLDPFSGSGTTGRVAIRLGRRYVGVELNREYIEISRARTTVQMGMGL